MNKSKILALLIIVVAVALGIAYFLLKDEPKTSSNLNPSSQTATTIDNEVSQPSDNEQSSPSNEKTFTREEVSKHNTESDCWTIVDEKVYSITSYIQSHPGGDEILRACGIEGTTLFTDRQTADGEDVGTGTPHSAEAENELNKLFIGTVSN